ncbi:MAG: serine/threonine-protein phosphatase [Gammaproteobacteria bacterium]|nr:MAG: serine/threonine-protein phosphatase [Gammaproteobacteria bacterium]
MTLLHPLEYSAATHPGLKRENNEDCFLNAPNADLWVVADGMGGHEAGEVASAIVRDTFEDFAKKGAPFSLSDAIQKSHQTILTSADKGIGAHGMGSTVVALQSQKKNYQIAWVGDSRAYLWTPNEYGGELTRLTTDHSYVQMLFASGAISAAEVENHPDKNIITQCLGMQELAQVKVDITQGQWQPNQWILLCSDGLTDELSDTSIAQILEHSQNTLTAVDQLLHEALTSGGHDNITLQIIESPIVQERVATKFWQWIPEVTHKRKIDAVIFFSAIIALLVVLINTLK